MIDPGTVNDKKEDEDCRRLLRKFNYSSKGAFKKELAWVFFAIALLLFAADSLVKVSVSLAMAFNLPLLLVGLLIVAVGTTLPELVFSIEALRNKQSNMVLGNLLGSIVANGTLVIGLAVLISPITIANPQTYLVSTMAFLLIFTLFYFFVRSKQRLDHWEGALLLIVYLIFAFFEWRVF